MVDKDISLDKKTAGNGEMDVTGGVCLQQEWKQIVRFLLVGGLNTVVGMFVMAGLYWAGAGYWVSSAGNVLAGGVCSFFLNRNWTFRAHGSVFWQAVWFCLEQLICYLIAYGIARPLIEFLLQTEQEVLSLVLGMVLFPVLNYGLQRNFVFRRKGEDEDDRAGKKGSHTDSRGKKVE